MKFGRFLPLLLLAGCVSTRPAPSPPPPPAAGAYVWLSFDRAAVRRSGASGMADRALNRPLTVADPVRIASVSKLFVALGVMRLVEQGKLDLDRDVSQRLGWRLRNPAFPDEKITLRLLLSHRSGLRDEIDYAIPLGTALQTALADPRAFDPEHRPGTFFRYSNLNFPVIASVMEIAAGERFDRLMEREVLRPLGIDGCFNWSTCSDAAVARAVVLYEPDGRIVRDDLKGVRPTCMVVVAAGGACDLASYRLGSNGALFSPQGGLRISVEGLSVAGRLLLSGGIHDGRRFLSQASIEEMLRPHWRFDGANGETENGFYCSYGLGVQILPNPNCRDDISGTGAILTGHAGDAYRVKSGLWIDRLKGRGIAYFATGIAEDAPTGDTSYRAIEEWLARKAIGSD
ncbi:MAG: beta-lactamase family protein [Pseudomonadota bacterium]|nr:beta-lactamase family protein [Pseudomonadota bacterium]